MEAPRMNDDQITLETLELQRRAILASKTFTRAQREELLRLNAFGRALLEAAGASSLAEIATLIATMSKKGSKEDADSAN
jgi:hypothetical protein